METRHVETLARVFADVLETTAFMFAERTEKEELQGRFEVPVLGSVTFAGPYRGEVAVIVCGAFCVDLPTNILGLPPGCPVSGIQADDAFKELLNVVCGQLLTALAGEDPVFRVSLPALRRPAPTEVETLLKSDDTLAFKVEESPVLIMLKIEAQEQGT